MRNRKDKDKNINNIPEIEYKDRSKQEDKMRFDDQMLIYSPIIGERIPVPEPTEYNISTAWRIIEADKTMSTEGIRRLAKEEYQESLLDEVLEKAFNKRDMKMWRKRLNELYNERTREMVSDMEYEEYLRDEIKRAEGRLEQELNYLSMLRTAHNGSPSEEVADETFEMIDNQYVTIDEEEELLEYLRAQLREVADKESWLQSPIANNDGKPIPALFEKMLGAVEEIDDSNNIPEIEHKDRAQEDKMRFHDPMPIYSPITGELVPMPEPTEYSKGTAWDIISADETMSVKDITRLAKEEYQDMLLDEVLEEAFQKRDMKMWRKRLNELYNERTREMVSDMEYEEYLRDEIKRIEIERIEERLEQEHNILSMLRIQLNGSFSEEEADDTMEMIDNQYAIMDGLEALLEDLWERQGEGRSMNDWGAELNAKYDAGPGVKPSHALFEKMLGAVEEIDDSDLFGDDFDEDDAV